MSYLAKVNTRFWVIILLMVVAAFSRVIPHPINFAPVGAMALFGGAYLQDKKWAFFAPLLALWVSDVIINYLIYDQLVWFYQGFYWVYGAFSLITLLGVLCLKSTGVYKLFGVTVTASFIFFIISNFGVWYSFGNPSFPPTMHGLWKCYMVGLPYLWNTLFGDLFYAGVLFGSIGWVTRRFPVLRIA